MSRPLRVVISHGQRRFKVRISPTATFMELKKLAQARTGVPPGYQTVFLNRENVSETPPTTVLSTLGLAPAKIVKMQVIGSQLDDIIRVSASDHLGAATMTLLDPAAAEAAKTETPGTPTAKLTDRHKRFLKRNPDQPSSGIRPSVGEELRCPNQIPGLLDSQGSVVRLVFLLEQGVFKLCSNTRQETIGFRRVRDVFIHQHPENEKFIIVGLQMGRTDDSVNWIYYVPVQFRRAIKYTLAGRFDFPF